MMTGLLIGILCLFVLVLLFLLCIAVLYGIRIRTRHLRVLNKKPKSDCYVGKNIHTIALCELRSTREKYTSKDEQHDVERFENYLNSVTYEICLQYLRGHDNG